MCVLSVAGDPGGATVDRLRLSCAVRAHSDLSVTRASARSEGSVRLRARLPPPTGFGLDTARDELERRQRAPAPAGAHRVVIVGSGFGGLFAAKALRRAPAAVTLVDQTNHHLFAPLLYQVATGILSPGEIAPAIRDVLRKQRNITVELGQVTGIDVTAKRLSVRCPDGVVALDRLRQPDPRRRRHDFVLRQRPLRAVGARDEDRRRCAAAPRADLRRVRDGRVGERSRQAGGMADLRDRGRRPHRGRARRADRGACPQLARRQLPDVRSGAGADPAVRRRRAHPADVQRAPFSARRPGRSSGSASRFTCARRSPSSTSTASRCATARALSARSPR